jgi:hypothetical protein
VGDELFHADRQTDIETDRHTDRQTYRQRDRQKNMTKLIVACSKFAKNPENVKIRVKYYADF